MPEPIKIAFVGTSCVGKTTLLQEMKNRLSRNPKVVVVEEAARIFFAQNPTIQDRFSFETQRKVQELALKNEKKAYDSNTEIILCDRSVIDAVVYVKAQGDAKGSERLFKRVKSWIPTYDRFLLLDPEDIPYQKDKIRQEDEKTRKRFHQAFIEFFNEKDIPFELLSGTIEERLTRVYGICFRRHTNSLESHF